MPWYSLGLNVYVRPFRTPCACTGKQNRDREGRAPVVVRSRTPEAQQPLADQVDATAGPFGQTESFDGVGQQGIARKWGDDQ